MANYELASRTLLHHRARRRIRRHWFSFISLLLVIATWYLTIGPSTIGGPVTYAVVSGTSMEPELFTGDLVITRSQSEYQLGDTVLIEVMGGFVIHDIIWQSEGQIRTRGVNNPTDDTWTIPVTKILGKKEIVLPGVGGFLVYLRDNPLALGLMAALLAVILLFEPRRKKPSERLEQTLQYAEKEMPQHSRNIIDAVLTGLFVLSAISLLSTGILLANRTNLYPRVLLSLVGVMVSVIAFEIIGNWVLNGRDLAEPYRSIEVFRNRLLRIDATTRIPGPTVPVKSAKELLVFSQVAKSPVLHLVSDSGDDHKFFVITDDLNYLYDLNLTELEKHRSGRHRK